MPEVPELGVPFSVSRRAALSAGLPTTFGFMALQDVQELANFFERRVSAYQVGVTGEVDLNASF